MEEKAMEENNQATNTEGTENNGAGQENNQAQNQQGEGNSQSTAENKGAKTYTQAELDALIEKRLARERKKYQQQNNGAQQGTDEGATAEGATTVEVDVTEDARNQAAVIIAQANQRLIQAIAQSEATKLNINPDYIADAVRLADLSAVKVDDNGVVDTKSITTALEAVLERMPILKATTETPAGGFKVGGQGGNNQSNGWTNNTTRTSGETKRWNKNRI
jgi:hypothetical protein